jgi:phosphoribosylformimino-5-aminoimidazole carboxamide ribotide isomerase
MKFRPCIDLHAGKVKQIVGSTLTGNSAKESGAAQPATNFSTDRPASDFAKMYLRDGLTGGHVILLGKDEENVQAARSALSVYPNGLQLGGGVSLDNALSWLEAGASHVIVTSFVFKNGKVDYYNLEKLVELVGKDRLCLDLSCRRKLDEPNGPYYVVTDRWQNYTDVPVNEETLKGLAQYCDEFLVHGVENEGKRCGILEDLVVLLGKYSPVACTYAGGVNSLADLDRVKALGDGKVDLTIGSALDCFGGDIKYDDVVGWHKSELR